jgi:hypothetical protein
MINEYGGTTYKCESSSKNLEFTKGQLIQPVGQNLQSIKMRLTRYMKDYLHILINEKKLLRNWEQKFLNVSDPNVSKNFHLQGYNSV